MPVKVEVTPTSVKFDPEIPWIEDEISEVVIRNPAGRDITFTYPPAQSGKRDLEIIPSQSDVSDDRGPRIADFHDDDGVYVFPCTD